MKHPSFPKQWQNRNPLSYWTSEKVYILLRDFYEANFAMAGLSDGKGWEYVDFVWENLGKFKDQELRLLAREKMLEAKDLVLYPTKELHHLELMDLSNTRIFLDIGANNLRTINHYIAHGPHIEHFFATDIVPMRFRFGNPSKASYFQVEPDAVKYPDEIKDVDTILLQFVLHHFKDVQAIRKTFEICRDVMVDKGSLYIWEETFEDSFDWQAGNLLKSKGVMIDEEFTNRFYALDSEGRWQFVAVNDWLINVNYDHMPWTGQYYSWSEWNILLKEYGFERRESINLGLRRNGRLKQGVHMLGIWQ